MRSRLPFRYAFSTVLAVISLLVITLLAGCGQKNQAGSSQKYMGRPVSGTGDTYVGQKLEAIEAPANPQLANTAGEDAYQSYDYSGQMALLINKARCNVGLTPLTVNSLLNQAATTHAMTMAQSGTVAPPASPGSYIRSFGYQLGGWGMNYCAGGEDTLGFYEGWGGDNNVFVTNPQYREIGFGYVVSAPHNGMAFVDLIWAVPSGATEQPTPNCAQIDFSSLPTPVPTVGGPQQPQFNPYTYENAGTLTPGSSSQASINYSDIAHVWKIEGFSTSSTTRIEVSSQNGAFIIELYASDWSYLGDADTLQSATGIAVLEEMLGGTDPYYLYVYAFYPGDYTISMQ